MPLYQASRASADPAGAPSRAPRSTGLIAASRSWPAAADPSSAAWLGDAPHLQAFREPGSRLDLRPRHVLQQSRPATARDRLRRAARGIGAALLVNGALISGLVYLLSFGDSDTPRLVETPIEVVTEPAKPTAQASGPKGDGGGASQAERMRQALAAPVAPDPKPPAPAQVQPVAPPAPPKPAEPPAPPRTAEKAPPTPEAKPEGPRTVAPPPEPTRAATEEHQAKPANADPAADKEAAAEHEAKPAEVPRTLATAAARASFAVPAPAPPPPKPVQKPTPPSAAREPTAAQKFAAVLPMAAMAMPTSFRSALAGNGGSADAAYKGAVFGQFNRHPEVGERARQRGLKGQVVIAFTIDDAGNIAQIGVAQSSGDPALDAIGEDLVRASAPFPPPPPDAQRSFTPALTFGG